MSFGNFLRKLSVDSGKHETGNASMTNDGSASIVGFNSILNAPGKLLESVNEKTGTLVSDLNQKLDLSGKLDTIKSVSVTKIENVLRRHSTHEDEEQASVKVTTPTGVTAEDGNKQQEKIRRQSTHSVPKPPRPPPPSAAALSRAMSLDERNLSSSSTVCKNPRRIGQLTSTLTAYTEREEELQEANLSRKGEEMEEDSSASEYGALGDNPIYEAEADSDKANAVTKPTSVSADQEQNVKSYMVVAQYIHALLSENWSDLDRYENDCQVLLGTTNGRQEFVNKFDEEISKGHDQISLGGLPTILDRIGSFLTECQDAEDFGPAKKFLTTSLQLNIMDPDNPSNKSCLFAHIKDQAIWQSLRFWNACFFQSIQEARAKAIGQKVSDSKLEQIVFEQLSSYLKTMNVFNLHETIKQEFLRKHSNLFNLSDENILSLRAIFEEVTP